MLARDWFYNDRRQAGLDFALAERAASYDKRHGDAESHARATLESLGVAPGWRIADIGCGTGTLACEAALLGAEAHAIDISPAMLSLAEMRARDLKVKLKTQASGFLSFACEPDTFDLIVSEFAMHHLPDFWKSVALSRMFAALKPGGQLFLRDVVFIAAPDGAERTIEQWADFVVRNHDYAQEDVITHLRDEHSTFGWVIERLIAEAGFALQSSEHTPPVYGTYRAVKPREAQRC